VRLGLTSDINCAPLAQIPLSDIDGESVGVLNFGISSPSEAGK
jgi:hypothetical protein